MRNRWFPARIADYVPFGQLKQMKAQEVDMARDFTFGVKVNLEEVEEDDQTLLEQPKRYVRPIEIDVLSVCRLQAIDWHWRRTDTSSLNDPWSS